MHEMIVRSDARAMSSVTALDTRVSSRWQPSDASKRTFDGKPFDGTSHCISYRIDADGNKTDMSIFRQRKVNRKPSRYNNTPQSVMTHRMSAADLPAIGNVI